MNINIKRLLSAFISTIVIISSFSAGISISYVWYENLDIPQFYLAHTFGSKW